MLTRAWEVHGVAVMLRDVGGDQENENKGPEGRCLDLWLGHLNSHILLGIAKYSGSS